MDDRDLALEGAVVDLLTAEDVACDALREAVAWRAVALVALAHFSDQLQRAERLERRLRQAMGVEAWHPEEGAA